MQCTYTPPTHLRRQLHTHITMGKKEKNTRHNKTTTKQTNLAATYQGVLDIAKSGMGFVMVPNMENDILVFPTDFNTALKGDEVKVKITKIRQGTINAIG